MPMQCITVYTKDFSVFSDIYEEIINTTFTENEEKEFDGIIVSESGEVPTNYLDRMRNKREVAILYNKERDITIMQHGQVFEILIPDSYSTM